MEKKAFEKMFREKKDSMAVIHLYLKDGGTLYITDYKFSWIFKRQILIYFNGYYIGHILLKAIKDLM